MKLSRLITVLMGRGASAWEANIVCPAITPTIDATELVVNGTFNTDLTGWDDVSDETGIAAWVNDGNPAGACDLTRTGAANGRIEQAIEVTDESWYKVLIQREGAINLTIGIASKGIDFATLYGTAGSFGYTLPITSPNIYLGVYSGSTVAKWADNISMKLLVFTSLYSLIGERTDRKNGTFRCAPTIAAQGTTGMLLNYEDDNNFVLAVVTRTPATPQARLYSRIGGNYTLVISGNITYGNGYALQVIADGGQYSLYYNGIQVGAAQAIVETTLGEKILGFNTVAGDTVGTVITSDSVSP